MNHTNSSQGPINKQEWRNYLRQKASGIENVSHEVCQNILKLLTQLKTETSQKEYWAAYMAMPKEISVESLLAQGDFGADSVSWVFPKVFKNLGIEKAKIEKTKIEKTKIDEFGGQITSQIAGQITDQAVGQKMKELRFFSPGSAGFVSGYAGISEPAIDGVGGALRVPLSQVVGVLVPGLGFDKQGVRLGHGQGFYDRTLQGYLGFKIGVTCEALLVDKLPSESTDVCMDYLVTEKKIYKLGV